MVGPLRRRKSCNPGYGIADFTAHRFPKIVANPEWLQKHGNERGRWERSGAPLRGARVQSAVIDLRSKYGGRRKRSREVISELQSRLTELDIVDKVTSG